MVPIYLVKGTKFWKNLTECNFNILEVKMISREKWRTLHTENDKLEVNMAPSFPVPLSPVAYRRELGVQTPTSKFRGPSNIVAKSTRLWKLLNIAEFRKPTPQDVREKGSKILKLPSVRNSFTLAMTNKLAVIINGLKIPKIKKILLYEMKFLLPNYSCLHNPWLGGCRPQIPVLSVLCHQLNLLTPPHPNKISGYATLCLSLSTHSHCSLFQNPVCCYSNSVRNTQ